MLLHFAHEIYPAAWTGESKKQRPENVVSARPRY
jgi:hypothetical protein